MANLQPLLLDGTPNHIANNPGAKYDRYTGTDHPYQPDPHTEIKASSNLRLLKDYASFLDDVYHQGGMGSCAANSSAAIYRFEFRRHIQEAKLGNKHVVSPSRLFIYYNGRLLEKERPIRDRGAQNRDILHGLERYGVCEENDWTYIMFEQGNKTEKEYEAFKDEKSSQTPTHEIYKKALDHRIKGYYRLDIDRDESKQISGEDKDKDGQHVEANIKACISEGHPFIFGFYWEKAKHNQLWAKRPDGSWSLPSLIHFKAKHVPVSKPVYGHSVVGIGYDKDGILCQNSWGTDTTDQGVSTFWVPWDWVTDYTATNDFWMIRVVGE